MNGLRRPMSNDQLKHLKRRAYKPYLRQDGHRPTYIFRVSRRWRSAGPSRCNGHKTRQLLTD